MVKLSFLYNFGQIQQGKFRNVEFFILKDGDTTGGRKNVTHEYPNSDRRFIEDIGLLKNTYNLEIYVDNLTNQNQRNNLITALNKEGTGTLIHPFYGSKTVSVKGWTAFNDYGWTRFNVTFQEADPSVLPLKDNKNKSLLERLKDQMRDLQETKVGTVFDAVGKGFRVFNEGVNKVNDFSNQMLEVSNAVLNSTSALGDLQNTIFDTLDNVALLVKSPTLLADRISLLFTRFELIGERTKDLFDATAGLFGFGDDDTITEETIKLNNDTINTSVRANALAIAYNTAVNLDYNNEEELDEIRGILETEYEALIEIVDDDTLNDLKDLRAQADLIFNELEKTVPKIFTVIIQGNQNIHQIVFNYYGNFANDEDYESKVQEILDLNNFTNPAKIRGEIKLLTA
jgi:prophage DNA circulation protein